MNIMEKPRVRQLPVKMPEGRVPGKLWTCFSGPRAALGRTPGEAQENFFKGRAFTMKGNGHAA